MEKEQNDRSWHLIRNDNGEWISDENVVMLNKETVRSLQTKALMLGKDLRVQHGCEGSIWCYKYDLENY